MSYLTPDQFESIRSTVSIVPISHLKDEEILQYSFDCEEAKEYEIFLKKKAPKLNELAITETFLLIHNETNELVGYFSLSADTVRYPLSTETEISSFLKPGRSMATS